MPFYEYECASCKFYTELMQKISDAPLKKCPSCGKSTMKKLVSAPVFRLKGSGWYETDFKSEGERKRNLVGDDKAPPAEKSETKGEAKSADKPAEKAEAKAEPKPEGKAATKPAETRAPSSSRKTARKGSQAKRPAASRARSKPKR